MSPIEVYQEYLALKSHFGGKYDYHKYGGKLKVSESAPGYTRDKIFFQKVAKHPDVQRFLLANIMHEPKAYIRDIAYDTQAEITYKNHVARTESLGYLFKQDLKTMDGDLNSNIISCNHPPIVLLYLSQAIMFETLCIVVQETNILRRWEVSYPYDPVIEELIVKIKKYTPFINYERARFRKLIADEFNERN